MVLRDLISPTKRFFSPSLNTSFPDKKDDYLLARLVVVMLERLRATQRIGKLGDPTTPHKYKAIFSLFANYPKLRFSRQFFNIPELYHHYPTATHTMSTAHSMASRSTDGCRFDPVDRVARAVEPNQSP